MVYHEGNMVINIAGDLDEFNRNCAMSIMEQINKKPQSVMGFATGSTPEGVYRELVELNKSGRIDFRLVKAFNLDEYYPIGEDNPQSYARYMDEHLYNHVNIKRDFIHIPDGTTVNVAEECERYERSIKIAGYIDYQILGIGENGHIGFNEPDDRFPGATHLVPLSESTIKANSRFFPSPDDVPRQAITMGIKTIMSSKRILLMATGSRKAVIIKKALFGDITPHVPASVLQLHTNLMVVLDNEAASEILPLLG